jgi:putative hemolysin
MEILILGLLILLNGFFALSEIALVSSKKQKLEQYRKTGSSGAKTALKLMNNSEGFLSAIQVGITLIGIVTGVYGGLNLADDAAPFFEQFESIRIYADEIALGLIVIIITYFSIVFGELVPKTIALAKPERIAVVVSPAIYYFSILFYPFVKILSASTNMINKLFRIKKKDDKMTELELIHMLKIASSEGVIEMEQNLMHEKVFYFSDKKAKHIMTHRTDIEWINLSDSIEKITNRLETYHHSKIICSNTELDNYEGVLHVKDFFQAKSSGSLINISELMEPPLTVPENVHAQKVLTLMKQKKKQFCCVVNEYGSFEGIITLHDIIENIVGDIPDEDESGEPDMFIREDKSILVSGDAPVEILTEIIEDYSIDFESIDYSTISGFVYANLNQIPRIGDKFSFMGYSFEIVDVDGKKVDKILITKKTK